MRSAGPALLACLAAALAGGCVESSARPCGDVICPVGRACAGTDPPTCVDEDLIAACEGLDEGAACVIGGGRPAVCTDGLCLFGGCGDGIINADNECDGADLGGETCLDHGSSEPDGLACVDCQIDTSGCRSRCGDGAVSGDEECDGVDFDDRTCIDFGFYAAEGLTCIAAGAEGECTINRSGCTGGFCGDDALNGLEPCDGALMGETTCLSLGYAGATAPLRCAGDCTFDPSSCLCGGFLCAPDTETCVDLGEGSFACQPCPKTGC